MVGRRPNARIVIMTPNEELENGEESQRFAALEYVSRSLGGDVLQNLLPS
jgi:hypothetical protein